MTRLLQVPCRGERHFAFPEQRTALLLIDMQRDFCAPEGASAIAGEDIAPVRAIVPRLRQVLEAARRQGLVVIHTREGHLPDLSDLTPAKRARSAAAGAEIGSVGPLGRLLVRGEYGHDFIDELTPLPGEAVFDKPGFGAFYRTELEAYLRGRGIEHLILTGVTTQCCVQSTLREAVDRGYHCLTLEDCCAAFDPRWHAATFEIIASEGHLFGWVASAASLLDTLRTG